MTDSLSLKKRRLAPYRATTIQREPMVDAVSAAYARLAGGWVAEALSPSTAARWLCSCCQRSQGSPGFLTSTRDGTVNKFSISYRMVPDKSWEQVTESINEMACFRVRDLHRWFKPDASLLGRYSMLDFDEETP